jgi:hypothetical protein
MEITFKIPLTQSSLPEGEGWDEGKGSPRQKDFGFVLGREGIYCAEGRS